MQKDKIIQFQYIVYHLKLNKKTFGTFSAKLLVEELEILELLEIKEAEKAKELHMWNFILLNPLKNH